jgi:hypothetical protein
MSRKHRKQKKSSWPILLIAGALLLAAVLWISLNSTTSGGTPAIAVDQQKIDFGDVKLNDNRTFTIKVTNTGDGTLRFKKDPFIEIVEGC